MSEILGQQVVIENIGGAGGMTGSKRVADAAPDGYTFGVGSVGTHAQNQTLYKKPAYNSATDFTPIALMAETPIALTVRKDLPVNNFKEFVAYAKANHEKMQFGSAGAGSATHLGCVVLNSVLGINITHVPYRGTGPAMQDLHGGRIDYLCEIINTAKPHIDWRRHQGAGDHDEGALAGAAGPSDGTRAGHAQPGSLYLERGFHAQGRARRRRQQAQCGDRPIAENAGGA